MYFLFFIYTPSNFSLSERIICKKKNENKNSEIKIYWIALKIHLLAKSALWWHKYLCSLIMIVSLIVEVKLIIAVASIIDWSVLMILLLHVPINVLLFLRVPIIFIFLFFQLNRIENLCVMVLVIKILLIFLFIILIILHFLCFFFLIWLDIDRSLLLTEHTKDLSH